MARDGREPAAAAPTGSRTPRGTRRGRAGRSQVANASEDAGGRGRRVEAEHPHAAALGAPQARQMLDERGGGTVLADEPEDNATLEHEVGVEQGSLVAEPAREPSTACAFAGSPASWRRAGHRGAGVSHR